jgi:hypothetical protein
MIIYKRCIYAYIYILHLCACNAMHTILYTKVNSNSNNDNNSDNDIYDNSNMDISNDDTNNDDYSITNIDRYSNAL